MNTMLLKTLKHYTSMEIVLFQQKENRFHDHLREIKLLLKLLQMNRKVCALL